MDISDKALAELIAKRIKEARQLNGISLEVAARRMGYKNDSQLSKLENAFDGRMPTVKRLLQISRMYGVSCDYLLGLTDDWDADEHHDRTVHIVAHLFDNLSVARRAEIKAICSLSRRVADMERVVIRLVNSAAETENAMTRFVDLNPTFKDEMRGGAKLARLIGETAWVASQAKRMFANFLATDSAVAVEKDLVAVYGEII